MLFPLKKSVVTNVLYGVAMAAGLFLMRGGEDLPQMLGTLAAVFALVDIGIVVLYGAHRRMKLTDVLWEQAVLVAFVAWLVFFVFTIALFGIVSREPEAMMGVAMFITAVLFPLVAIATNLLVVYIAPRVLAARSRT